MAKKEKNDIIGYVLDVLIFIAACILIVGIYYVVQIKVMHKDYANVFGYTFFEVATGSMEPTISVGDVVIVKLTKDIEKNDIIVFQQQNSIITHRLISINDNNLITKGDANNSDDVPVDKNDVIGKVIKIVPDMGNIRRSIASPEILGLIAAAIILGGVALSISGKSEEKDD